MLQMCLGRRDRDVSEKERARCIRRRYLGCVGTDVEVVWYRVVVLRSGKVKGGWCGEKDG